MSTHTPGPWTIHSLPNAAGDNERAWHYGLEAKADRRTFAEHEANARLIAAAPELLRIVKTLELLLRDRSETSHLLNVALEQAREAIAKVEGAL